MTHRLTALALLLLSGLILLAGPYPCRAQAAQAAAPEVEGHCHEKQAGGPALASRGGAPQDDCCADGSDALCEHACQGTAVLALGSYAAAAGPASAARTPDAERLLAPPPHGLDHVPLA